MTRPAVPVTERSPEPGRSRQISRTIGRAAILIGALAATGRVIGFGRQLVFARTVGDSCLGSAYTTANLVPNIIYDIVLGGALASIMVPVLAGPAERSAADPQAARETSQISSALLTWTVLLLAPVSMILALAAHPVIAVLVPHLQGCSKAEAVALGAHMLEVFAPQILLYGLAVVLYGILQAHRRFAGPAVAPVLSSLVVIAGYLAFVPLGGGHTGRLAGLSAAAQLTLSAGTTAGVAALVLTALVPALRLRLRLRPLLRFPDGVARRVRGLAMVGIAALVAQDGALVVVTRLANGHGGNGAVVLYNYGWQIFFAAYAVLAVPVAVSAFPVLSARAEFDRAEFDTATARARGGPALRGAARAAIAGLASALVGAAAGASMSAAAPARGFILNALVALLACCCAVIAFGVMAYALDRCDLRAVLVTVRRRAAS